jgi:cyclohexyl-isocyanide hydratase
MTDLAPPQTGGPRLKYAMLLYPGLTLLDLVGPQAAWGLHGDTHLVWKTKGPVRSDSGVEMVANTTFEDCPYDLDVLFVPGGFGTWEAMEDQEVRDFLQSRGPKAKLVTSVCTGSIILAAAGLLDGHRCATHWSSYDILEEFPVQAVRERVVVDRNRITGGGVTAGIDFGLSVLAQLLGEDVAKITQLMLEYDPAPPFNSGSPSVAEPHIIAAVMGILG